VNEYQGLERHGGYHTSMFQYGTGAASNFSGPGNGTTIPNPTPYINYTRQLLYTDQLVFQPNDKFAVMPIVVYPENQRRQSATRLGAVGVVWCKGLSGSKPKSERFPKA